jgi:3D (Asp-Asp-Asp) domain-containing protein
MERRFGHDFSQVRAHCDAKADLSARAVHANAYTVGREIVFRSDLYRPDTPDGKRLLAHELTHVVQQRESGGGALQRQSVDDSDGPLEEEAIAMEDMVASDLETTDEEDEAPIDETFPSGGVLIASNDKTKSVKKRPPKKVIPRKPKKPAFKCPDGYVSLGKFNLTAYALAQESEFPDQPTVTDPCGLKGTFRQAFLFQTGRAPRGVKMQGSGQSIGGQVIHYAPKNGSDCFDVVSCPLTASGSCATSGRTVAVDRDVIPLRSDLFIEGLGERKAEDTGGRISGHHIDVYYGTDMTIAAASVWKESGKTVCRKKKVRKVKKKK